MHKNNKVFRPTVGVRALCFVIYFAAIAGWIAQGTERFKKLAIVGISVVGALWLADVLLTKLIIREDEIFFVSNFRRRIIPRTEIADVTWERGPGVYLKLKNGKSVRLPHTGHDYQGLVNTIRAWLKKRDH
jgi:hypothetical protein